MSGNNSTLLSFVVPICGAFIWICGANGSIVIESETWEARPSLQHDSSPVHSVAISADGSLIATASKDQTVKLWNAKTLQPQLTFRGHTNSVLAVTFSPDRKTIASGGYDA